MKRRYTLSFDTCLVGPALGAEHVVISGDYDECLGFEEVTEKLLASKNIDPFANFPNMRLDVAPGYVEDNE